MAAGPRGRADAILIIHSEFAMTYDFLNRWRLEAVEDVIINNFLMLFAAEGQVPQLNPGWVPYHSETYHSETYHSEFLPFEVGDPAHGLLIIQKLIIQKMHCHLRLAIQLTDYLSFRNLPFRECTIIT